MTELLYAVFPMKNHCLSRIPLIGLASQTLLAKTFRRVVMNVAVKLLVLCPIFLPNTILAQTRHDHAGVKVYLVSIRDLPQKEFLLVSGDQKQAVEISSWRISREMEVTPNATCVIRRGGAEDPTTTPLVARFTLNQGQKHQLVVLLPPTSKTSGEHRVTILNIDPHVFRGGERYTVNLTQFPVVIKLGNDAGTPLGPGKITKIIEPAGKNGDFLPVVGVFKFQDHWKPFMTSRWIRDRDSRSLVFIYADARTKSLAWNGMKVPFAVPGQDVGIDLKPK